MFSTRCISRRPSCTITSVAACRSSSVRTRPRLSVSAKSRICDSGVRSSCDTLEMKSERRRDSSCSRRSCITVSDDHRRREREQPDENRHARLGKRAEREQLDRARANRRVHGERADLLERRRRPQYGDARARRGDWKTTAPLGSRTAIDDDRVVARAAGHRRPAAARVARRRRRIIDGPTTSAHVANAVRRDRRAMLGVLHRIRDRDRRLAGRPAEYDGVVPVGLDRRCGRAP